ncbi:ABC transporter permease subunit [candidate division KSB1 bacterium]|nr:ABC transporter permease subunit [candidate division KSB1 bacterium]
MITVHPLMPQTENTTIIIGSKKFTENIILGDIVAHLAHDSGYEIRHRKQLGGTRILWKALTGGDIDIYPEYTGTIRKEIFHNQGLSGDTGLDAVLRRYGVSITPPLGFNNTYAIGVTRETAERLGLQTISDLKRYPQLVFGFTNEFMDRQDGWPGLRQHYRLPQQNVRGLDHDLAYRGIAAGSIDVIDMYSTDAEIKYYDLGTLTDDLGYFPDYEAVYLYRTDLTKKAPELVSLMTELAGQVSRSEMVEMNAAVKLEGETESSVAAAFVNNHFSRNVQSQTRGFRQRLWTTTKAHLFLVGISLGTAILLAIPLGIVAAKFSRLEKIILGTVGIIQTIPSLALLVFMIPLLGIGGPPAIVALFLYSLLPIVRNTYTGIHDIPIPIRQSAFALGLPWWMLLRRIELPLVSRSILAGIKTSAVINVGTATLGALIGAGGYGQPILTGIRLDNIGLILEGAIPAATLALLVQGLFDLSELVLVPKGLRLKAAKKAG